MAVDYYSLLADQDPRAAAAAIQEQARRAQFLGQIGMLGSAQTASIGQGLVRSADSDRDAIGRAGAQNFNAQRLREAAEATRAFQAEDARLGRDFTQGQQERTFGQQREMEGLQQTNAEKLARLRASLERPRGGGDPLLDLKRRKLEAELTAFEKNGGLTEAQVERREQKKAEVARLSDKQAQAITDLDAALSGVDNLVTRKQVGKGGKAFDTGPLAGRMGGVAGFFGLEDADDAGFRAQAAQEANAQIQALSGAGVPVSEVPRLMAGIPNVNDQDEAFVSKSKTSAERLLAQRKALLEGLERQGKDVSRYMDAPKVRVLTAEDGERAMSAPGGRQVVKYQVNPKTGKRRAVYSDGTYGAAE